MTNALRWVVVVVLVGHGLIHLLGVAKAFGWAAVPHLEQPIGAWVGLLWLLAAVLVLASAVCIAAGAPTWWWVIAACGAAVSQVAIVISWSDAKAGTVLNVILVLAAVYGFASLGPSSFNAQWQDRAVQALKDADPAPEVVTEADLVDLPEPLAAYVRCSGAVGKPRVTSLYADVHGRIRGGSDKPWMPFTGKQLNTYGPRPQRAFIMNATMSGLPVTVLHLFGDTTATMRAKLLSLVTVVDASGPDMDRGETVTVFNDLVVLAPGAIADASVQWTAVDAHHVRGVFTNGNQTVSAELTFNAEHDLVNFASEDRLRASTDGKSFTRQGWSTPLTGHRKSDGHRVFAVGEAQWRAPQPEGPFTYVEFHLDAITYNVPNAQGATEPSGPAPVTSTGARTHS
jgi:hypothetical protein